MVRGTHSCAGYGFSVLVNGEQREVELMLAGVENAPELVGFHNAYYRTKRKPEHWIWEYEHFEPGKSVFMCARDNGVLIATHGVMPIYMEVGNRRILSGKVENVLCLLPYRGTGVFENLSNCTIENCKDREIQLNWVFTAAVKAFEKYGYTFYDDIKVLVRPGNMWVDMYWRLRGEGPLHRRLGGAAKAILKSFVLGKKKRVPEIEKLAGYEIDRDGTIDERNLKDLYERVRLSNRNLICVSMDERYLEWRVRKHPFLTYREYQVRKEGTLSAYAFVTLFHGIAAITDMLSEDGHATSLLLETIIRDYRRRAGRFRFMGNSKDYIMQDIFSRLRDFGFSVDEKTSVQWHLGVNNFTSENDDSFNDIGNWHITSMWTEGFLY